MIVFDSDDFGANHVISGACQSHDCRDILDKLHYLNGNFKVTLFAIPSEMTQELLDWCEANSSWVELAVHGFTHRDNWECEKITYQEMDDNYQKFKPMLDRYFVKGFKAPGWQISQDAFEWLYDNDWWVGDQSYNNTRRPAGLRAYVNDNGIFRAHLQLPGYPIDDFTGVHTHTWNCVGNGVYELYEQLAEQFKHEADFSFVSEVLA